MPLSSEEAEGNPLSFMARQEAGGLSTTATQRVDSDLVLESGAFSPLQQKGSQTTASSPNIDRKARCGGTLL